jgi:hypothetical protein
LAAAIPERYFGGGVGSLLEGRLDRLQRLDLSAKTALDVFAVAGMDGDFGRVACMAERLQGCIGRHRAESLSCGYGFRLADRLHLDITNRLVGFGLWNKSYTIGHYLPDKLGRFPHRKIESGIVHGKSTLCSAISLAVALQYDEIVLVGVDLYDSRYFWLEPDKTLGWSDAEKKLVVSDTTVRGAAVGSVHNTVNNGIVSYLGEWNSYIERHYGARLSVYNPKSLLVATLPLFQWN